MYETNALSVANTFLLTIDLFDQNAHTVDQSSHLNWKLFADEFTKIGRNVDYNR